MCVCVYLQITTDHVFSYGERVVDNSWVLDIAILVLNISIYTLIATSQWANWYVSIVENESINCRDISLYQSILSHQHSYVLNPISVLFLVLDRSLMIG